MRIEKEIFIAIFWIVLTSIITGCKAASDSQTPELEASSAIFETPIEPTQVSEQAGLSWIFETPVDPIQVAVVLDMDKGVEAVIPVEGGTLSATGADGTVYTLEIPADALLNETPIGLIPVTSLSGLPFGNEQTYSVQLSPAGLFFQNPAILTIVPAEEIPLAEQIVFGYQADGKDLILAAPVVDSSEIKIQVQHFSGNGVTKGLLADIEPVRERLGGSIERRLESALNAEIARLRQQGSDGEAVSAAYAEALLQYEAQVVKPRVAAAGESCAAGQLAIQTVLRLERMRQLLGLSDGGNGLDKYPGLMDKAARVCVVEEFELCVEEHVIHRMLPVWLGFERQYALLGIAESAVLREARELTVKCLTFKLNFESTSTVNTVGGGGYESTVKSEITLRFNPDELTIKGEAPLVNEDFEFFLPVPDCVATGVRGGGTFKAFRLEILDEADDKYGHVRDFKLSYLPGNTSESASIACPDGAPVTIPAGPFWTGAFVVTHFDELDSSSPEGEGYISADWEILGAEYFAKKEWIKEDEDFVEAGTFKLYHRPGE